MNERGITNKSSFVVVVAMEFRRRRDKNVVRFITSTPGVYCTTFAGNVRVQSVNYKNDVLHGVFTRNLNVKRYGVR